MNLSLSCKSPRTNVFQGIICIGVTRLIIPWCIWSSFCTSSPGNSLVRMAIARAWEYMSCATAKTPPPGPPPAAAILACPCVLPECEPRATPLSTRSILAVCRVNRLPLFPFSFVPHGRPPPFPTVRDIRTFLLLFFVSPIVTQEKHVFQKLWCGRRIFPPYPPLGTYFEEKVCC